MPIERKSPLPSGVYWVNVPADGHPVEPMTVSAFNAWLRENASNVRTHKTVEDETPGWRWYLFRVISSGETDWKGPGYPNIAERGLDTTVDDSIRAPEAPRPVDAITDWLYDPKGGFTGAAKSAFKGLAVGLGLVLGLAALVAVGKVRG